MHNWGDDDVDWQGISEAAYFIGGFLKRWGRVHVTDMKEKFGCYDEETRILTDKGFKHFKDLDIDLDKIACLIGGDRLEFHKATEKFEYYYDGLMYQLKTRGVDLLVTPNHKLYVAKADIVGGKTCSSEESYNRKEYPFILDTYETLFKKQKKFKKGAIWEGKNPEVFVLPEYSNSWIAHNSFERTHISPELHLDMKKWVEMLGWYVAEGSCDKSQVTFSLNGLSDEPERVSKLLSDLGFESKFTKDGSRGIANTYSVQLQKWLEEHCGKLAENKRAPDFIKELSPNIIKIFLDALYEGDGHRTATAYILTTVSPKLADDVMELLLKAGYCSGIYSRFRNEEKFIRGRQIKRNFKVYEINWLNKNYHQTHNSHDTAGSIDKKESLVPYTGKVYCVSAPEHIVYVERGGKGVWCGNSTRVYTTLGWQSLLSITHPGWCHYSPYPKWLMWLDIYYLSRVIPYLNYVVFPYHKFLYRLAYKKALAKWPHLELEILCGADWPEYLKGLSSKFDDLRSKNE